MAIIAKYYSTKYYTINVFDNYWASFCDCPPQRYLSTYGYMLAPKHKVDTIHYSGLDFYPYCVLLQACWTCKLSWTRISCYCCLSEDCSFGLLELHMELQTSDVQLGPYHDCERTSKHRHLPEKTYTFTINIYHPISSVNSLFIL